MVKTAKPIFEKDKYYQRIEERIIKLLDSLVFKDMDKIINENIKQYYNSINSLNAAILAGRIQYNEGRFTGSFNALVSRALIKLGAKFDSRSKAFNIEIAQLPQETQQAIGVANSIFKQTHAQILLKLCNINLDEALQVFSVDVDYETTLTDLDEDLYQTLKDDVSIIPELTPEMKKNISEEYSQNLSKYIKDFSEDMILKLRSQVEQNALNGYRAKDLVKIIEKQYNVSRNKAKFLARQETSLLISKFREERYKDAGIKRYRWSTSKDARVRPDHKRLQGKIFDWENPPIIDDNTGRRGHPGEDFGCRCVAIPIVEE